VGRLLTGHFGEPAIDESGTGDQPPKAEEVKRKIDTGLHKMWRL